MGLRGTDDVVFRFVWKNTLFKDNISFELESLYFHYLYQLILIAEWKLYETACGGGVKTWPLRFWKHYYYSIDIQLDKEKEIYLMFLKLETDKKQRKNMSTYTCKLSLQQQNFQNQLFNTYKANFSPSNLVSNINPDLMKQHPTPYP